MPPSRRNNQPPNRNRAPGGKTGSGSSDGTYSRKVSKSGSSAARGRSERLYDLETWDAIQAAKNGDDSQLLPYSPTPSINPPRPRTLAAGYDAESRTLFVRFRDGTPWEYFDVPPRVWNQFRRADSPGQFINRVLNNYEYGKGIF